MPVNRCCYLPNQHVYAKLSFIDYCSRQLGKTFNTVVDWLDQAGPGMRFR